MSDSQPPIAVLLAAWRAGDLSAGDVLLRRFEPWLRLLARQHWQSRFQAKFDPSDVAQQAWLEAVKAFPQFRGSSEAEFAAWLRGILAHALAHEVRRYAGTQKRDLGRERSLDETLSEASQRLGDILPGSGTAPGQRLMQVEQQTRLAAVLERLPEDYREIITLRHVEGLPHEEVARRLGRNPGAVRMLWVRALARLREEVEKAGLSEPGPGS